MISMSSFMKNLKTKSPLNPSPIILPNKTIDPLQLISNTNLNPITSPIEEIKDINSNPQSTFNSIQWLKCPLCHIKIPSMSLTISSSNTTNHPMIIFTCTCNTTPFTMSLEKYLSIIKHTKDTAKSHNCNYKKDIMNHIDQSSTAYCIECQAWLCEPCLKTHNFFTTKHHLFNEEIQLRSQCKGKCNRIVTHYCFKCFYEICDQCATTVHNNHEVKELNVLWDNVNKQRLSDKNKLTLKEQKALISDLNLQVKTLLVEKLSFIINELSNAIITIESQYSLNEHNNNLLMTLINEMILNFTYCNESNSNYNIVTNASLYTTYKPIESIENIRKRIEKYSYSELIGEAYQFYKKNYIVKMREEDEVILRKWHATKEDGNGDGNCRNGIVTALYGIDFRRIVSGMNDGTVKVWDVDGGEGNKVRCVGKLRHHFNTVSDLCYIKDKNNDILISSGMDGRIIIYNLINTSPYITLNYIIDNANKIAINSIIILEHPRLILTTSYDNSINIWDIVQHEISLRLEGHTDSVTACVKQLNGRFASSSLDKSIRIWDTSSWEDPFIKELKGHNEPLTAMLHLKTVIISAGAERLTVWNEDNWEVIGTMEGVEGSSVMRMAEVDCGRIVTVGSEEGIAQVWDVKKRRCVMKINNHMWTILAIGKVDVKDDKNEGKRFVTGGKDGMIIIWEIV